MAAKRKPCPNGHTEPPCTHQYCMQDATGGFEALEDGADLRQAPISSKPAKGDEFALDRFEQEMILAHRRMKLRQKQVELDAPAKEGAELLEVEQAFLKAAKAAAAEVIFQLGYGSDKQRIEAARDVLDALGVRKKEPQAAIQQVFILNGDPAKMFPFMKGAKAAQIVDAEPAALLPVANNSGDKR